MTTRGGTSVRRIGLGWDRPCLVSAADWLLSNIARDWGDVMVVTPGRRAQRVLLRMMLARSGGRSAMASPRLVTPGPMVDELIERAASEKPWSNAEEERWAWARALRESDVEKLLPQRPDDADVMSWLMLGKKIAGVHEEMAGAWVRFEDAADHAGRMELFGESERWEALARARERYVQVLTEAGLTDRHEARRSAVEAGRVRSNVELVLVGVAEMSVLQRKVVEAAARGIGATALVHAPMEMVEDEIETGVDTRFDAWGCVSETSWANAKLSLRDEQIMVADRPEDQAQAVLRSIAALGGSRSAGEITIGLGDDGMADVMHRSAAWAGVPVRSAGGKQAKLSGPVRLLEAMAGYLTQRRFADLATLVRHPDVERVIVSRAGADEGAEGGVEDWATMLDRYFADHLHERLSEDWLGRPETQRRMKAVYQRVQRLAGELASEEERSVGAWSEAILGLLTRVYGETELLKASEGERLAIEACMAIRDVATIHAAMSETLSARVSAATALRLTAARAGEAMIAEARRAEQIEMLGWLELALDPSPVLVLMGVNDGSVPDAVMGDALLPDGLRRRLGMMHNERRLARDAFLLESMAQSREQLVVITGRRTSDGEPLRPSRLLLACESREMARRVKRMTDGTRALSWLLPLGAPRLGERSRFVVPALPNELPEVTSMSVTWFREYLQCPFRFALRRIVRLEAMDDSAAELDALRFGTLAHAVLNRFGRDAIADSANSAEIKAYLVEALRLEAAERFGPRLMTAVRVQMARLEERLSAFASMQAQHRARGWRIEQTEFRLEDAKLTMGEDEKAMPLRGVIDRVDVHERSGKRLVVDYKTGDKPADPEAAHFDRKKEEWVDLQLPLYWHLGERLGWEVEGAGYVTLPRDPAAVRLKLLGWDRAKIEDAVDRARKVVRAVRRGEFAMNEELDGRFDDFARICQTFVFGDGDEDSDAGDAA